MSITNTITVSNDSEILDKIVSKTITELLDDRVLNVRAYCFYQCESLKTINFPNATSFGNYAFYGCSALEKLDAPLLEAIPYYGFVDCVSLREVNFPNATTSNQYAFLRCTSLKKADFGKLSLIHNGMFSGATSLDTLVLRNEEQVCTNNYSDSLRNTPIANGTGYVYVPRSLADAYKADAKWSVYANQIRAIEDYSAMLNPYTWDAVFENIDNGIYKDVYKVGDLVPLDLGSEGVVNMQIAGIDVDTLADGSGTAPISWISKELLNTTHRWNPSLVTNDDGTYQEGTGTIGGWEQSELRAYCNDTLLPLIPSNVAAMIKTVTKTQPAYDTAGTEFTQTTTDSVWVPIFEEIFGSSSLYYPLFKNTDRNRVKYKVGTNTAKNWWMRDAFRTATAYGVLTTGSATTNNVSEASKFLIALCFCT